MKLIIFIIICKLSYIFAREIESPPRIIKQPPSQEIFVSSYLPDEPLFIECAAIGEPSPKYKWFKNNQFFEWQVYDDRITQLPGQGTLVFSSFENADAGYYQCVAENNLGTAVSNSVSVQRATFNSFPNEEIKVEAIGKEDEPFNLKCDPPRGFPQPKIYWMTQFTDGKLQVINSSRITTDPTGNLWFSYLTQEDVSNDFIYICVAASLPLVYKLGNKRYLHVLIPNKSPLSTNFEPILQYVSPKIKQVVKGTTADVFCIFGGKPVPETKWLRNGEPIEYSERLIKANYGKSLVIKLVDINDTGTYVCEVSNGIGESKSYTINLEVLATPSFTEEPESVTVGENETAEFHCSAFGIPKPQIQWTFNGKPIEEVPPNKKRKVGVNKIIINNLTKLDIGNYGCNASNYLGYIYKDVYVNVLGSETIYT